MTHPELLRAPDLRAYALSILGGFILVGAGGCQKNTAAGSAASDASADYGVVTPQSGGGDQPTATPQGGGNGGGGHNGGGHANGAGGGGSGYAQPVSELAPTPPPELPTYDQPPPPAEGNIWTPGYWAWNTSHTAYYWAPGTWVQPPREGVYWTPGYWRHLANGYGFVPGYWGPTVGFYGGVNYGWGYGGQGYEGGRWRNNHFYYNQSANNLGARHFSGVYSEPVRTFGSSHSSFNGGPHGVDVPVPPPRAGDDRGEHIPPTQAQREQVRMAAADPELRAGVNHGAPPILATARPGQLKGPGVVTRARSASHYDPPARTAAPTTADKPARQEPGRPAGPQPGQSRAPENPATQPAATPKHQAAASTKSGEAHPARPTPAPARPASAKPARTETRAGPKATKPEYHGPRRAEHVTPPVARRAEAPHTVAAKRPPAPHPKAVARPAEPDREKPQP